MAITLIKQWVAGLATAGPALPRYAPWWNSSSQGRNIVWVDSSSTATEDGTEDRPYTQLGTDGDAANTTAMSDDTVVTAESPIIVIKAGHTETISAASTFAKTGLTIIGLGSGSTKPAFTNGVAGTMWTASGVRQHIYNCRFPASSAASGARIIASAADFIIEDCDFTSGTNDTSDTALRVSSTTPDVRGCTFTSSGTTSARGSVALHIATSGQSPRVTDCSFYAGVAGWDIAMSVAASLDFKFRNLVFTGVYSTVRIATGSRGWIAGVTGPGIVEWTV